MNEKPTAKANGEQGTSAEATGPQLQIIAQYVKDLSFENPRGPIRADEAVNPNINVSVDVKAGRVKEERFNTDLKISVRATEDSEIAFLVELTYTGLFVLRNVPEDSLQPVLLIECPRLLFPFARRIVADATRDGGFPPLMLDPIDFAALYRQQMDARQAGTNESGDVKN